MSLPPEHLAHFATATWIGALAGLMLPHERVDLSPDDCEALLEHAGGLRRPLGFSAALREDLAQVMAAFPDAAHIRLEGCSLRAAGRVPRIGSVRDAMRALSAGNIRVASCQALLNPHLPEQALYLFPWVDIPPTHEFRAIIRGRAVLGITPYHGARGFAAAIHARLPQVEAALMQAAQAVAAQAPQADCAADLFLDAQLAPRLVEVNPLGPTTDTGLFNGDFDGRLRYPAAPAMAPAEEDIWRV